MVENKDGINYPMTSGKALDTCDQYLNDFERTEIKEFEKIYYLATDDLKVNATKAERLINNGYDDNDGYYRL